MQQVNYRKSWSNFARKSIGLLFTECQQIFGWYQRSVQTHAADELALHVSKIAESAEIMRCLQQQSLAVLQHDISMMHHCYSLASAYRCLPVKICHSQSCSQEGARGATAPQTTFLPNRFIWQFFRLIYPRMSQVGVQAKHFLLALLAALFCTPSLRNGGVHVITVVSCMSSEYTYEQVLTLKIFANCRPVSIVQLRALSAIRETHLMNDSSTLYVLAQATSKQPSNLSARLSSDRECIYIKYKSHLVVLYV